MSEYYPGYIFHDGEDYPEVAAWCNANGCYIKEITPDGEGRRFEIVEIPPKALMRLKPIKSLSLTPQKITSSITAAWNMRRIFSLTMTRPFCVFPAQSWTGRIRYLAVLLSLRILCNRGFQRQIRYTRSAMIS